MCRHHTIFNTDVFIYILVWLWNSLSLVGSEKQTDRTKRMDKPTPITQTLGILPWV